MYIENHWKAKKLSMVKKFILQIYWIMHDIMEVIMVIEQIFMVFQKLMILLLL